MKAFSIIVFGIVGTLMPKSALAGCYFPLEFQGEFLTQSMTSREIAYNSISILFDSVPGWGNCHRRLGRHVILADDSETCFRCLSIVSRSPNVLQIHTNGGGPSQRCHPTEEEARAACPTDQQIRERRAQEMMLYKTRGFYGSSSVTKTYCPINGDYKFTYSINDGTEDDLECGEALSEASDCPTGYKFDLRFRGCSFPDFEMSFQCLAHWPSDTPGETYMSLLDTKLPQLGEEARPRYRCALFKEDPDTGLTHVALSSDSTCVNHLYSSQDGYETLHMAKEKKEPSVPAAASEEQHPQCIFPDWLQGEWEGLHIDGGTVTYRDEAEFVTYRGRCVSAAPDGGGDRYVVHLETDCGRSTHSCALFKQRDANVLEFQLGTSSSDDSKSDHSALCHVDNFSPSKWLTLGRSWMEERPHCPLVGEYTGVVPDAEGLCARSYTDCNNPEVMFYTVFNCHNRTEVFEEREYRCFGQWEDPADGLVYTYTQRWDIPGNECFVGRTVDDDRKIIAEAGQNCERGHEPDKYGMTLHRQAKCMHEAPPPTPPTSKTRGRQPQPRQPEEETIEQLLREEEEEARTVSPRLVHHKNRHKHRNRHHGGRHGEEDDILSNEIPGSSSRSSASAPTLLNCLMFVPIVLSLWTHNCYVHR